MDRSPSGSGGAPGRRQLFHLRIPSWRANFSYNASFWDSDVAQTHQHGPVTVLHDAILGHSKWLEAAMSPMVESLESMHQLAAELYDNPTALGDPSGPQDATGSLGRTLLQSSGGGSCGGSINASQVPSQNSPITSFSPAVTSCSIQPITTETVIMANILGAITNTASAIGAMQVCVWEFTQHCCQLSIHAFDCHVQQNTLNYVQPYSQWLDRHLELTYYQLSLVSMIYLIQRIKHTRPIE